MMQDGALTLFALYNPCRTNTAPEQYLTSKIRSRIKYLIPSCNIIVLVSSRLTPSVDEKV